MSLYQQQAYSNTNYKSNQQQAYSNINYESKYEIPQFQGELSNKLSNILQKSNINTQEKNKKDEVDVQISLCSALSLLQLQNKDLLAPIQKYIITNAAYKIQALPGQARVNVAFTINSFIDSWIDVNLFNDKVSILKSSIQRQISELNTELKQTECITHTGILVSGQQGVTFNRAGIYVVDVDILVAYNNTKENEISLEIPSAACNTLQLTIPKTNIDVKIFSSLCFKKLVQEEKAEKTGEPKKVTVVNCLLPPLRSFSALWTTQVQDEPLEKKKLQKLMLTVSQDILHSIGGGIVNSNIGFQWTIRNGSVALFQVEIDSRVRIVSVKGPHIKKWEVVDGSKSKRRVKIESKYEEKGDPESQSLSKLGRRVLKIYLSYGQERGYDCRVMSELKMGGTSGKIYVPVFKCIGVKRETGNIGVEAKTNVEVRILNATEVKPIDPSELPCDLKNKASTSILHAFKFLNPNISLELQVIRHQDVAVIVASCDRMHVELIYTEEGFILTKMIAEIRNSQKQFLRIKIPPISDVWSVSVSGAPVKPSKDDKEMIMIPLRKSHSSNNLYVIDFIYFRSPQGSKEVHEMNKKNEPSLTPMGARGEIKVELPVLDIPIQNLFVSVYLPRDINYGEFVGELKKVEHWRGTQPPHSSGWRSPFEKKYQRPQREQSLDLSARRESIELSISQISSASSPKDWSNGYVVKKSSKGAKMRGILPVQVNVENMKHNTFSKCYKFKNQLVNAGCEFSTTVPYTNPKEMGYCQRVCRCTIL